MGRPSLSSVGLPVRLAVALGGAYVVTRLLLVWRFPYHVDEGVFAGYTLQGFEGNASDRFIALTAGQQPLLEWLGMGVMALGFEPLTALRLVSVSAGLVTLAVVAWLGAWIGGPRVGFTAALLWVIAPFALVYTTVGLYDPLAAMFVVSALAVQIRLAEDPRWELGLLLGLVFAGALLTKLTATVALYLLPLGALLFDWRAPRVGRRLAAWLGYVGLALVVAWAAYQVLWLSDFRDDLGTGREVLARHDAGEALERPWHWLETNWPPYRTALIGYLTPPLVGLSVVGAVVGLRRSRARALVLLGWFALPLGAVVLLASYPYVRWVAIVVPPLVVLAAVGVVAAFDALRDRVPPRRWRQALAVSVVAAFGMALAYDAWIVATPGTARYPADDDKAFVTGGEAGTPWEAVAAEVRVLAGGRDLAVMTGDFCCGPLWLELRHDENVEFVRWDAPDTDHALYALENVVPLQSRRDGLAWRELRRFERPRNGEPVVLYESGVVHDLTFVATPDELRGLVGGSDSDFDAFVQGRPAVGRWLEAWYEANQPS